MGFRRAFRSALIGVVSAWAVTGAAAAECSAESVALRGDWGQARFRVEVADDAAERAQGLMFVRQMPRFSGMLFVYDRPQAVAFWMRNTFIPLDMIFVAPDGVVARVHHRAKPLDTTSIPGGDNIQYVLEINGGLAEQLGIAPGTQLQHPALDQTLAAWPCDAD